jgi:hypothetical protein
MLSCLVSKDGSVYVRDGFDSHSELADIFGVNENDCLRYGFSLVHRKMLLIKDLDNSETLVWANKLHDEEAQDLFDKIVGTPEKLMSLVEGWRLSKFELVLLLNFENRQLYLRGCERFEKEITKRCWSTGYTCFNGKDCPFGSVDEVCMQACLDFGRAYNMTCAIIWRNIFEEENNRIEIWKK